VTPRIAIPLPTSFDPAYNRLNWPDYANAISACGGEPVEFPLNLSPRAIAELANTCQAVLLPGSPADVNPGKYGQTVEEGTAPADLPRENVDELLIQDAHNLYKPILGICFGCQILNIWRSGTLLQDLTILPVNHAASRSVAVAHSVELSPTSLLMASIKPEITPQNPGNTPKLPHKIPVNSSHHQAIGIPGDGLRIAARCPQDGVIEAIEGGLTDISPTAATTYEKPDHWVLGIQWHPERTFATDPNSRQLFQTFVNRAKHWKKREILTSIAIPT